MTRAGKVVTLLISIVTLAQCAVLTPSIPEYLSKQHTPNTAIHTPQFTDTKPETTLLDKETVSDSEESAAAAPVCTTGFPEWMYHAHIEENKPYDVIPIDPTIRTCQNSSGMIYTMEVSQASPAYHDRFWINNITGHIHMNGTLDYEKVHRIDLVLKVQNEDGGVEGSAFVFVDVIDVNDNPPEMSDPVYNITVKEDAAIGTFLFTLSATDADSGNNSLVNYFLGPDHCPFSVLPDTGVVILNEKLDFETKHQYSCNVYAMETSTTERHNSSFSQLILNVDDVNDNSPVFTQNVFEFAMSWPLHKGDYVGMVTAYDKDSGSLGSVVYSVESPYNSFLDVDQATGIITVTDGTAFPFSKEGINKFVILAQDGGNPPRMNQTEVRIQMVKGYNRWFFYQTAYSFTVMEDAPQNTEVGRVEVNASDVTYRMSSAYTGLPFTVTPSGVINLTPPPDLDYDESNKTYFFTVEADDNITTVSVNVTINIGDVNDNTPVFITPSKDGQHVPIGRLTKDETVVFTVTATDKDSGENGNVTYSIPSTLEGQTFAVNLYSGAIYLRKSAVVIDAEELYLTVQATDQGARPNKRDIQLVFIKEEGRGEIHYLYIEIEENHAVNVNSTTLLGIFETIKEDLEFEIDKGNNESLFTLSGNTVLTSKHQLDYETHQYWDLRINVTGKANGLFVGYIYVAIKVIDLNDNSPIFLKPATTTFDIPITAQTNTPIYRFVAHDKDSMRNGNAAVAYSIDSSDTDLLHLNNATGDLTLKRTLQKNDTASFTISVKASDPHNEAKGAQRITFKVFDPKQGYPEFDKLAYFGSVPENYPVNSRVMLTEASLSNFPFEHDVTIDVFGTDKAFYTLSPYGDLHTNASFDREVTSQYSLAIQSTAGHRSVQAPKSTMVFALINVSDVNDESPHFPFKFNRTTVSLEAPPNVTVATIEAIDADSDAKLQYNIIGGNAGDRFALSQTGNTVRVNAKDPSLLPPNTTFHLQLWVEDGLPNEHNDTTTLIVAVE